MSRSAPEDGSDDGPGRFIGLGWLLWDHVMQVAAYPTENEKVAATSCFSQVGGPVVRALLQLRRFGAKTSLVAAVADDHMGREALAELLRHGVDVGAVSVDRDSRTRAAQVWLAADSGTRTVAYSPRGPDPHEPSLDSLAGAEALLLDGRHPDAALRLSKAAVAMGVPVVVDMGSYKANLTDLVQHARVVIGPSRTWARLAEDHGHRDPLDAMRSHAHATCVLTDGVRQIIAVRQGELVECRPAMVTALDSNGAGDVFFGAFAWAHTHGFPLTDAVRFSAATAALKCARLGNDTLPSLAEVAAFMVEKDAAAQLTCRAIG